MNITLQFFLLSGIVLANQVNTKQERMMDITQGNEGKMHAHDYKRAITKEVLPNGMTVLLYKTTAAPKVLVQVAYNIGSYAEEAGERGLAHLLEHMIFKGTQKLSETDIDTISRKYGASYNAFTSHDMTSYFFETNKNNWKPFIEILADCMKNARFDDQHLASELWAVIQELKMNKDNYWRMMLEKVITATFPAHHPYHTPIIGYKEDLLDMSGERLREFYNKYYHPDRALLVVAGDIDPGEVMTAVREQFSSIPAQKTHVTTVFPQQSHELVTLHTRCYEDVTSDRLVYYWRIPGLRDIHEVHSTAAAFLLGSGENSRLYKSLVDDHKVAASVGVFPYKFMEEGLMCVFIEPMPGQKESCKKIVEEELLKAIEHGFTHNELKHMLKSQKKALFKKLEQPQGLAYEWISSYFATGNEYSLFEKVDQFTATTSEHVQQFIAQYLDPFVMNTVEVLPMPESKKAQSLAAKEASDELDKKILTTRPRTTAVEPPRFATTIADPLPLDMTFPKPDKTIVLDNGLTVMLHSARMFPTINVACRFKNVAYHTEVKDSIILDLMMGMLIEGSEGYTKERNVSFFDEHGAEYLFSDSGASLSLLSDAYADQIRHFLHVLLHPTFPQDAFEKMRVILVDTCKRAKDDQKSVAFRTLNNILHKGHPYAWTYDDALELAQKVTIQDLEKNHTRFVTPGNMIVSLVGDFELNEMEHYVKEVFGTWSAGPEVPVDYTMGTYEKSDKVSIPMLRDQVYLLLGQPSPLNIYHEDIVPTRLLDYITFHALGSRLFQLREQSGLFYTASGGWAKSASKDNGFDFIATILTPSNVEKTEQMIRSLVDRVGEFGVTFEELMSAQQLYFKTLIDMMSTNSSKAGMFCTNKDLGRPDDFYDTMLKRVREITLDDVNRVAKKYFSTKNMTSIRVGRV